MYRTLWLAAALMTVIISPLPQAGAAPPKMFTCKGIIQDHPCPVEKTVPKPELTYELQCGWLVAGGGVRPEPQTDFTPTKPTAAPLTANPQVAGTKIAPIGPAGIVWQDSATLVVNHLVADNCSDQVAKISAAVSADKIYLFYQVARLSQEQFECGGECGLILTYKFTNLPMQNLAVEARELP